LKYIGEYLIRNEELTGKSVHYQYLIPEHVTKYYIKPIRRKEHIFCVLENMVLRRIFGLKKEGGTGG
jgi:hypothetical protein